MSEMEQLKQEILEKIEDCNQLISEYSEFDQINQLRKLILLEIVKKMKKKMHKKTTVDLCNEHLFKYCIEIEKQMFKQSTIKTYSNSDKIDNIVNGIIKKCVINTEVYN